MSRVSEPVDTTSTSRVAAWSPSRITEPLPNCFSIWPRAAASAFLRLSSIGTTFRIAFMVIILLLPLFHSNWAKEASPYAEPVRRMDAPPADQARKCLIRRRRVRACTGLAESAKAKDGLLRKSSKQLTLTPERAARQRRVAHAVREGLGAHQYELARFPGDALRRREGAGLAHPARQRHVRRELARIGRQGS